MEGESFMVLKAEKRTELGTAASRKARNEGKLPASIYGREVESIPVLLDQKEFDDLMRDIGENGVFDVEVSGSGTYKVFVKQRDNAALKRVTYHVDLLAFKEGDKVAMTVPIYIRNEDELEEGVVSLLMNELNVEVAPADAPDQIEINVSDLEIGDSLKVEELIIPEGVEVQDEATQTVLTVTPPTQYEEPEDTDSEDASVPEPEVIGEEKEDKE